MMNLKTNKSFAFISFFKCFLLVFFISFFIFISFF